MSADQLRQMLAPVPEAHEHYHPLVRSAKERVVYSEEQIVAKEDQPRFFDWRLVQPDCTSAVQS